MDTFYTNVQVFGSKILYRGVENGIRIRKRVDYYPTLYVPSQTQTDFRTIKDEFVSEIKPGSIRETKDFVKRYEGVSGFKIYGNQRYEYAYISDNFRNTIEWNKDHIRVCNIDIEVGSENGFPEPSTASEPIVSITYKISDQYIVFGCGDFVNKRSDARYIKCRDEIELIKLFIDEWSRDYPDIITGWYVRFFDIPYLVNRIKRLLGDEFAKRLSPWNYLAEKNVFIQGKEQQVYMPSGVAVLDYMELYKRFAPNGKSQESYRLDAICAIELGERKLSYEEYGSLHTLYRDNYQRFIEYNIRDVELVEKLDNKLKLIELALTIAYNSKSANYEDVFAQVRMWDSLIYNHLRKHNVVVPPSEKHDKDAYTGAYVKEPIVGFHSCVASFDLASMYPSLIQEFNISPDTLIEPSEYTPEMAQFMSQNEVSIDNLLFQKIDTKPLKSFNATITPNGQLFTLKKRGFLADMMRDMFEQRTVYKKQYLSAMTELESETDPSKRTEIENRISKYNNLQSATKICLNSAYGAVGNEFFRFFDMRQAMATTTSGQLAIRWIAIQLNKYMNRILKTESIDYVIASHTDSVYLSLDVLVNRTLLEERPDASTRDIISFMDNICENKIKSHINKAYEELADYTNALEQKMSMKREVLADRAIWTSKTRYVLSIYKNETVEYAEPKIKVVGLEMIRSSTPSACRDKLKEIINIILSGNEDETIKFIAKFKKDFKSLKPDDIAFPRGVNGISEYSIRDTYTKGTPIHVKGSIIYNSLVKKLKLDKQHRLINEGDKIKFIYLKEPNPVKDKVISFPQGLPVEFKLNEFIDYDVQFEKSFLDPVKIITDAIGWKTERKGSLFGLGERTS